MGFWEKSKDVVMRKLLFRFFKFCVFLRVYCKIEMLMCDTVEEKFYTKETPGKLMTNLSFA